MVFQVTNSVGDTAEVYVNSDLVTQETYNQPTPALAEYIIYTEIGSDPDYRSLITGIRKGGVVRNFDEDYTIDNISIDNVNADNAIYNLQGVKVRNINNKGIYIKNGQKTIIK